MLSPTLLSAGSCVYCTTPLPTAPAGSVWSISTTPGPLQPMPITLPGSKLPLPGSELNPALVTTSVSTHSSL